MWSENDVTGAHVALMTLLAGTDSFSILDPMSGPMALMANIAAYVSVSETRPVTDVMGELSAAPLKRILEAISVE